MMGFNLFNVSFASADWKVTAPRIASDAAGLRETFTDTRVQCYHAVVWCSTSWVDCAIKTAAAESVELILDTKFASTAAAENNLSPPAASRSSTDFLRLWERSARHPIIARSREPFCTDKDCSLS